MGIREQFKQFRTALDRYENMERSGAGHIMSPMDPRKKLYKDSLQTVVELVEEDPRLLGMVEEVKTFEKLFK